ncbi:hypothetical protein K0M31_005479 [Melipona bicolor]|uniref:Uncharacterized protein n=1 Tax=Melipona bicolor TaxID=60889 RepID=A0AA40FVG0_9HYME|nr:hypothetical protein K0M31_005479 [Melipona bicolor]
MTFPKANPPKPKYPGKESFVRCPDEKKERVARRDRRKAKGDDGGGPRERESVP